MVEITRQSILAQASKKLRADFAELSVVPHRGVKGHEAEELVRTFLRKHLPRRFDVGGGFILDKTNQTSRQTDVIVYDALNCPIYRYSEEAGIYPSDNVAAVIEVKSVLDKQSLRDAFVNIAAAKSLSKTLPPPNPTAVPIMCQTSGHVFAFGSPLKLSTLFDHYAALVAEFGVGRHVDYVTILDVGMLQMVAKMQALPWQPTLIEQVPQFEGIHLGVSAAPLGPDALDGFLRMLLTQLIHFRGLVDHPGFDWDQTHTKGKMVLRYLCSTTQENDPAKREAILKRYADQVQAELAAGAIPEALAEFLDGALAKQAT